MGEEAKTVAKPRQSKRGLFKPPFLQATTAINHTFKHQVDHPLSPYEADKMAPDHDNSSTVEVVGAETTEKKRVEKPGGEESEKKHPNHRQVKKREFEEDANKADNISPKKIRKTYVPKPSGFQRMLNDAEMERLKKENKELKAKCAGWGELMIKCGKYKERAEDVEAKYKDVKAEHSKRAPNITDLYNQAKDQLRETAARKGIEVKPEDLEIVKARVRAFVAGLKGKRIKPNEMVEMIMDEIEGGTETGVKMVVTRLTSL